MKDKSFNKTQCSRLLTLVEVGNLCGGIVTVQMVGRFCMFSYISDKLCIPSIVSSI